MYTVRDITNVVGYDSDYVGIIDDILSRCDEVDLLEDTYEAAMDAIDTALIYDEDQWAVMKHFQRPNEANLDEAYELLVDDVVTILNNLKGGLTESVKRKSRKASHERLGRHHRRHRISHK